MRVLTIVLAFLAAPLWAQDVHLLMAEEDGCLWCERWTEELGDIYPKTAEGRAAPLMRYDIGQRPPDGLTLKNSVHYTPTFVLVVDGTERGRIEGYPGEDFFWALLKMMLDEAQVPLDPES